MFINVRSKNIWSKSLSVAIEIGDFVTQDSYPILE